MSRRSGFCPNCGAPVTYQFAQSVQTTCSFCHSILVRTDLDIRKVGEVAALPPDVSPVQLGAEGVYNGKAFTVAGRILYEWEQGGWNEWHIIFQDGTSGWLSDAQAEYAVSFPFQPSSPIPPSHTLQRGSSFTFGDAPFEVTVITEARYVGVEGELPFEYWDKSLVTFADLRSGSRRFATIDYSEDPPLVFLGETVPFDSLRLTNLRDRAAAPAAQAGALACPNCGAGVQLRAPGATVAAVCTQCSSVLDATSRSLRLLQQFQTKQRAKPEIPLGSTGTFRGQSYQAIGFQTRFITVEGTRYEWREYVLFSPTGGFRYLTEYDGHWNFVEPLSGLPAPAASGAKRAAIWDDHLFTHFQSAQATTGFVLGEFPWQVRVGEKAHCEDFIAPPYLLSSEASANEVTWSLGEYLSGEAVWKAFQLPGKPKPARGIFANQPSPFRGRVSSGWKIFAVMAALLLAASTAAGTLMANRTVFERTYGFQPGSPGEHSFVTPVFELTGRPSNVEIDLRTDLNNGWLYFNLALINDQTGQAWDWGREISFYQGRDSDGSWTEGSPHDSTTLGAVPAGRYYLRVEPEWSADPASPSETHPPAVAYTITVKRDVPATWPWLVGFGLLFIPPVWRSLRAASFETQRWQESDYG